ncbi:hypothetical protein Q8F55_006650 [Vanrija albida]|uniref:Uncharacterized protein n=1 Tax=Vanrija albida TaxID=181172 RepID=A0ABR3PXS9_9TREE
MSNNEDIGTFSVAGGYTFATSDSTGSVPNPPGGGTWTAVSVDADQGGVNVGNDDVNVAKDPETGNIVLTKK